MEYNDQNIKSISILEILQIMQKSKKQIVIITLIFSIISIIFSLLLDNKYEIQAKIKTAEPTDEITVNKLQTGFGSFFSNTNFTPITYEIINTIESKSFLKLLYLKYQNDKRLFKENLLEIDSSDLSEKIKNEKKLFIGIQILQEVLNYSFDHDKNLIVLTIILEDKYFAYKLMNDVLLFLKEYIRDKNLLILDEDIKFYQKRINNANNPIISDQIKKIISNKINKSYTLSSNVFSVIEYPEVPFLKKEPRRSLIVIISTFLGFVIGLFFSFFIHFYKNLVHK